MSPTDLQRPAAEILYAAELERLVLADAREPRPSGWRLTPRSVLAFILGDEKSGIEPKFVGSRALLERAIVALATSRGLMLIGEPGTAKSYLSELLSAAISGDSTLVVQGSAGTTEDAIKYSWNYALLLAEGPNERSLVSGPVHRGMRDGKIVRFEEITRCPVEIQDTLLSILSERMMAIPELPGPERTLFARAGFNIIATANTRDRGVNEMSAALKRRFNFETVPPIADPQRETALVRQRAEAALAEVGAPMKVDEAVLEALVTALRDLREGRTAEGWAVDKPASVMSTAEAVAVASALGLQAAYFQSERDPASLVPGYLLGVVLKDDPKDRGRLLAYWDSAVKRRAEAGSRLWRQLLELRAVLER